MTRFLRSRRMDVTEFVDLERRFHELTDQEVNDPENLAAWGEYALGTTSGWPELLEHDRVVLLAEAGAGKTEEMRQQVKRLVGERKFAFFVALDDLDRESIDDILSVHEQEKFEKWKAAAGAQAWFFLDAVDELKLTHRKLDRALRHVSRGLEGRLDRARVIVSCRPSDWRPLLDADTVENRLPVPAKGADVPAESSEDVFLEALRREYGRPTPATSEQQKATGRRTLSEQQKDIGRDTVRTFVMLPMSDKQIERFARQRGMPDVDVFLAAIRSHGAWTFARRPLDLIALMAIWKQSSGLGTRAKQHETNITMKLGDNPDRPGSDVLSEARAGDGAERLALALALTRTRSIRSPEQALDAERAEGVLDPDQILADWSAAERKALLRRALFDPATFGRVRFHHRSTQEYLAARRLRSLRERGMSTKALFRLLFATSYRVEVVLPSMRAIAAWLALWDEAVRKTLMEREPEILLTLGDPESLNIHTRRRLVREFVAVYGTGDWRGLTIPIAEVRRLAHPELASVIRECWNAATNDEARELLIDMIWQGALGECADLAREVAFDESVTPHHRVVAVRALVACHCDRDAASFASRMLTQSASWSEGVVPGVAGDLFPQFITAKQLVTLIRRTEEPKQTMGGFEWAAQQIAEAVEPLSAAAIELRNELADLVRGGRLAGSGLRDLRSSFGYLSSALATLCGRQWTAGRGRLDPALVGSSVIASRFGGFGGSDFTASRRESVEALRTRMAAEPQLRRDVFWAELAFVDEMEQPEDDWWRFHNVLEGSIADSLLSERDRPWLLNDLAGEHGAWRRPIALQGLIYLWVQNERRPADLEAMRANVEGDRELGRVLEALTAPRKPDEGLEEARRQDRECGRAAAAREERRLEDWKEWRKELIYDPEKAFSATKRVGTVSNIYRFLACQGRTTRYNVWDKGALVEAFGPNVAEFAEEAYRNQWRTTRPRAWSARSPDTRNQVPETWILGLAGVSAEAATPGWSARLSPEDVETATVYAMIELNGFAPFLNDLVETHPNEVSRLVGDELRAELAVGRDCEHLPFIQHLAHASMALKRLCAPYLFSELKGWPEVVDGEAAGRQGYHLEQALRILAETDDRAVRQAMAQMCSNRYGNHPGGPFALIWLRGLFRFDAGRGAGKVVEEFEDRNDPVAAGRAIEICAAVFGKEDSVEFRVSDPVQRGVLLGRLVRLAHTFIRLEDDQVHDGAFSPNTRDNAERARGMLFNMLCDTPGPEAREALLEMAEDGIFGDLRDRVKLLARERAAGDAEWAAFDTAAVVALEERYEAPPSDGKGLFAVMMDRLGDLGYELAHSDFSDRRTLRSIEDEREMQRTLSWRLREKANNAYRVMREEEVADAKEPDIRLATVGGDDEKVVLEVKIADNGWSLADLEEALRKQLVGQYLRHERCACGCLLLTYHGRKRYWVHPDSKRRLEFGDVVSILGDKARAIEREQRDRVRVEVLGLDLTDVQPASGLIG